MSSRAEENTQICGPPGLLFQMDVSENQFDISYLQPCYVDSNSVPISKSRSQNHPTLIVIDATSIVQFVDSWYVWDFHV